MWVAWVKWECGFTGGMSQTMAWVMWVAWVHKISALVKENGIVEMLVMSEICLYELLLDYMKFYM